MATSVSASLLRSMTIPKVNRVVQGSGQTRTSVKRLQRHTHPGSPRATRTFTAVLLRGLRRCRSAPQTGSMLQEQQLFVYHTNAAH